MESPIEVGHQTAQWHKLVTDAEYSAGTQLNEELESYLVFLLMRFTSRPDIAASILALEFLEGSQHSGAIRQNSLRDVGDKCLLYSGLFPMRARRRRVRISYFVDLGRSAYHSLAEDTHASLAGLFAQLAEGFVSVMDVMHAMRRLDTNELVLDPLAAHELWTDTGSKQAQAVLSHHVHSPLPVQIRNKTQH